MSTFLSTFSAAKVDLYLLRRDYFDGLGLLLQKEDGTPYDLATVKVCASVWKKTGTSSYTLVENINVEEMEPLRSGRIRLWLTSAQTGAIWDAYEASSGSGGAFFPNAYAQANAVVDASPLFWDVRIESEEYLSDLVSVSGGTFVAQNNHTLASSERVIFDGTTVSGINFNDTSATIYSGLTDLSYLPPYAFKVPALSGVTNAAIGGSVSRLKQDTVITGKVIVGTTLSNCFP
jgi:hypothetical protein